MSKIKSTCGEGGRGRMKDCVCVCVCEREREGGRERGEKGRTVCMRVRWSEVEGESIIGVFLFSFGELTHISDILMTLRLFSCQNFLCSFRGCISAASFYICSRVIFPASSLKL